MCCCPVNDGGGPSLAEFIMFFLLAVSALASDSNILMINETCYIVTSEEYFQIEKLNLSDVKPPSMNTYEYATFSTSYGQTPAYLPREFSDVCFDDNCNLKTEGGLNRPSKKLNHQSFVYIAADEDEDNAELVVGNYPFVHSLENVACFHNPTDRFFTYPFSHTYATDSEIHGPFPVKFQPVGLKTTVPPELALRRMSPQDTFFNPASDNQQDVGQQCQMACALTTQQFLLKHFSYPDAWVSQTPNFPRVLLDEVQLNPPCTGFFIQRVLNGYQCYLITTAVDPDPEYRASVVFSSSVHILSYDRVALYSTCVGVQAYDSSEYIDCGDTDFASFNLPSLQTFDDSCGEGQIRIRHSVFDKGECVCKNTCSDTETLVVRSGCVCCPTQCSGTSLLMTRALAMQLYSGAYKTYYNISSSCAAQCIKCPSNYMYDGNSCVKCTYVEIAAADQLACVTCPIGAWGTSGTCEKDANVANRCAITDRLVRVGQHYECSPCEQKMYLPYLRDPDDWGECTRADYFVSLRCPQGTYFDSAVILASSAKTVADLPEHCKPCDIGSYMPSHNHVRQECVPLPACPGGTYRENGFSGNTHETACVPCATGTVSIPHPVFRMRLPICKPTAPADDIIQCGNNTYMETVDGNTYCRSCPLHAFGEHCGRSFRVCAAGYNYSSGFCLVCNTGTVDNNVFPSVIANAVPAVVIATPTDLAMPANVTSPQPMDYLRACAAICHRTVGCFSIGYSAETVCMLSSGDELVNASGGKAVVLPNCVPSPTCEPGEQYIVQTPTIHLCEACPDGFYNNRSSSYGQRSACRVRSVSCTPTERYVEGTVSTNDRCVSCPEGTVANASAPNSSSLITIVHSGHTYDTCTTTDAHCAHFDAVDTIVCHDCSMNGTLVTNSSYWKCDTVECSADDLTCHNHCDPATQIMLLSGLCMDKELFSCPHNSVTNTSSRAEQTRCIPCRTGLWAMPGDTDCRTEADCIARGLHRRLLNGFCCTDVVTDNADDVLCHTIPEVATATSSSRSLATSVIVLIAVGGSLFALVMGIVLVRIVCSKTAYKSVSTENIIW